MMNQIHEGDAADVMKGIADETIDLTITSPPYDNLRDYKGFTFNHEAIADELYRITKQGGVVVWVVGDATIKGTETGTSFRQALYFMEIGFNLHDTMIYEKAQAWAGSQHCYLQSFEFMFIFSKGKPNTLNLIRDRENIRPETRTLAVGMRAKDGSTRTRKHHTTERLGKRKNIWRYAVGGRPDSPDHPAMFPRELAHDHIVSWSNEGDVVLDPMVGSGTTCIEALLLRRQYIGIDISPEYCDIARSRIETTSWGISPPLEDWFA